VTGHDCATYQANIHCFQFSPFICKFDSILGPQFFKMIEFCPLQFETKLIIKLNYNLYIHVKIFFYHLYIKSLIKYSCYFIKN